MSPAIAPALLVTQQAEIVDLDGPLLLASDRVPGLRDGGTTIHPPIRVSEADPLVVHLLYSLATLRLAALGSDSL